MRVSKKAILAELEKTYPDARPELNFRNPYETLVAVMLSAQCTDKQVNKVHAGAVRTLSRCGKHGRRQRGGRVPHGQELRL